MISEAVLRQLYPSAREGAVEGVVSQAGAVLSQFGISDRQNRLHFFLAQIGHESGGLRIAEENLNYTGPRMMQVWPSRFPTLASTNGLAGNPRALANNVYGGRMGNDAADDGWTYRGRGFIQITGKDGYAQVGERAGLDLVGNPDWAAKPEHALRVACAFWTWKGLNPKCDAGDFVAVTKGINGGKTGLQDRFNWLEKVQDLVAWPLNGAAPAQPEVVLGIPRLKAAQLKLRDLGLYDGSIDGIFGTRSRKGLKVYQADNGLPANGKLTQATVELLGI